MALYLGLGVGRALLLFWRHGAQLQPGSVPREQLERQPGKFVSQGSQKDVW